MREASLMDCIYCEAFFKRHRTLFSKWARREATYFFNIIRKDSLECESFKRSAGPVGSPMRVSLPWGIYMSGASEKSPPAEVWTEKFPFVKDCFEEGAFFEDGLVGGRGTELSLWFGGTKNKLQFCSVFIPPHVSPFCFLLLCKKLAFSYLHTTTSPPLFVAPPRRLADGLAAPIAP